MKPHLRPRDEASSLLKTQQWVRMRVEHSLIMLRITPNLHMFIPDLVQAEGRGRIHYPNLNRDAIISVVNTVTELGMPALFPILPELLAPKSGDQFRKTYCDAFSDVHALFIWEAVSVADRVLHHGGDTRVRFKIFTDGQDSAGRLAVTLLRLIEDAATDDDRDSEPPELRDLTYWLGPSRIYGNAYFTGFSIPFVNAHGYSCMYPDFNLNTGLGFKIPLSTWPPGEREQADDENAKDCYRAA